MQGYWITFTDGYAGYCEGQSPYDALHIAEHLTKKTGVFRGGNKYQPVLDPLPYPANPIIWQLDHPQHGKCPAFCYTPKECAGHTCCNHRPACTE